MSSWKHCSTHHDVCLIIGQRTKKKFTEISVQMLPPGLPWVMPPCPTSLLTPPLNTIAEAAARKNIHLAFLELNTGRVIEQSRGEKTDMIRW